MMVGRKQSSSGVHRKGPLPVITKRSKRYSDAATPIGQHLAVSASDIVAELEKARQKSNPTHTKNYEHLHTSLHGIERMTKRNVPVYVMERQPEDRSHLTRVGGSTSDPLLCARHDDGYVFDRARRLV